MTTRSVGSVGKFVDRHFPERQIYHRSRGSVQFITLSARTQIGLLVLTFGFLGWVAYASVNAVFKDKIIDAREQHFATIQAAYEGRLAEMQAAYDELNGAIVLTQERFTNATAELEAKHRELAEILVRQEAALRDIGAIRQRVASSFAQLDISADSNKLVLKSSDFEATQARTGDRVGGPLGELASTDVTRSWERDTTRGMPRPLAEETRRIQLRMTNIDAAQRRMAAEMKKNAEVTVSQLEDIIQVTGLNADKVVERVAQDAEAQGGPYVPLAEAIKRDGSAKRGGAYAQEMARLATIVDRLTSLDEALKSFPLVMPLQTETHVASKFGRRTDPFTSRPAFHYGLDFVGAYGTPVHATSPGIVTIASRHGPYGNLVEINHGNGIKTRYGHLSKILVKVGQHIAFQQQIGLLGSTGRSTGPHLHYEVRFNGTLRDPARFLEAGRHVFQS